MHAKLNHHVQIDSPQTHTLAAAAVGEINERQEREVEQWRQHVANLPPPSVTAQDKSAAADVGGDDAVTPPWVEDQGGYLEVPELTIGSAEELMGEFVNRSRPAVIKVLYDAVYPQHAL